MAAKPYSWLNRIALESIEEENYAYLGAPSSFSWEECAEQLADRFELDGLEISAESAKWCSKRETYRGLSSSLKVLNFTLGSLPGTGAWLIGSGDLDFLMGSLLTKQYKTLRFSSSEVLDGFHFFLGYETVQILKNLGLGEDALPSFAKTQDIPDGVCFCQDIAIHLFDRNVKARFVLSEELAHAWQEKFTAEAENALLSPEVAEKIDLILHMEIGKSLVSSQEWMKVGNGDFLVLDECGAIPGANQGELLFTVSGSPLFGAVYKGDKVQITEHPIHQDVETPMANSEIIEKVGAGSPTSSGNVPLTVTVEVGRIKMNLADLMSLKAGSILELKVRPEDGVNLVINGTCVARGELLRLGEVLGVRITEKG